MENDTSGFYKNDSGMLLYGKTSVLGGSFELHRDKKENYNFPVFDWYWFDSEIEARQFFNIPIVEENNFNPRQFNFYEIGNNNA